MPIRHKEMMERHVLGKLHAIVALVCLAPLAFALLQQLPCVEANISLTQEHASLWNGTSSSNGSIASTREQSFVNVNTSRNASSTARQLLPRSSVVLSDSSRRFSHPGQSVQEKLQWANLKREKRQSIESLRHNWRTYRRRKRHAESKRNKDRDNLEKGDDANEEVWGEEEEEDNEDDDEGIAEEGGDTEDEEGSAHAEEQDERRSNPEEQVSPELPVRSSKGRHRGHESSTTLGPSSVVQPGKATTASSDDFHFAFTPESSTPCSDASKCHFETHCPHSQCPDGQCVSHSSLCPFANQVVCGVNEFECQSDGRCIHESLRCDGFYDCPNYYDEVDCENRTCRLSQFRCGTGQCIDRAKRCNGVVDCVDDEMDCWICRLGEYNCANGQCIQQNQRCDGAQDCHDNSDEADCVTEKVTLSVYPERVTVRQGQEAVFRCRDEGELRLGVSWSREGHQTLPPGAMDSRGRLSLINVQSNYSGVYVCSVSEEYKQSFRAQQVVYLTVQPTIDYEIMINHSPQNDPEDAPAIPEKECDPDHFQCENGNCIKHIYVCDGHSDCEDESDEISCESEGSSNSTCKMDEYQCESGNQCIPKTFHCDGLRFDCIDKSDEIGCTSPTIVERPNEIVVVMEGETVTIKCRSIGIPVPLISWRKNGKHINQRLLTSSVDGLGTLTIRDASLSDQGSYSCLASNSLDMVFAPQDTLLVIKPHKLLCQQPTFNDLARDSNECLRCFCFGVSVQCHSSSVETRAIHLQDHQLTVTLLTPQPNGTYVDLSHIYPPNQAAIRFEPLTKSHQINSEVASIFTPSEMHWFYWRLPSPFMGNQLFSYGGHLKYSIRFRRPFSPSPLHIPDVIIRGNGITLYHYEKEEDLDTSLDDESKVAVRFWQGQWHRNEQSAHTDIPPLFEDTTREDIMIVLQNLTEVLIKASYDSNMLESSIFNVELESAQISNYSDPHRSAFIEQCTCPDGYSGSSCEQCAPRYIRQPSGAHLQRCIAAPIACQCNGHSEECAWSGECLNCAHHTEGFNCERCQRGYYSNPELAGECMQCPCGQNRAAFEHSSTLEEQWEDVSFPEKWLLIPCRYDTLNRDVVCESCPIGYEGRLCQECARGYTRRLTDEGEFACDLKEKCNDDEFRCGNGTCVGNSVRCNSIQDCLPEGNDEFGCACAPDRVQCTDGRCVEVADQWRQCGTNRPVAPWRTPHRTFDNSSGCSSLGTLSRHPESGECQCKSKVVGPLCDQCSEGAFSLNGVTLDGCIECFCFGLTRSCTAAFNLYRDYVELKMDQYLHGIILRDLASRSIIGEGQLTYDHLNRELIYRDMDFQNDLFWQLPYQFLGNKLTSYGGYLNYTFRFEGNHFPQRDQVPTALMSAGEISLSYHYKGTLNPFTSNVVSISLHEDYWSLSNGQPAHRRDLMMVLSRLDTILLRATVSSDVRQIALSAVTLDTTVERSGLDLATQEDLRVETVEECRCPFPYRGLSCEKCAPGYKISKTGNANGNLLTCEPCSCHGHSTDCSPETGICINCQHNTTGPYCEKCMAGFDGNPVRGTAFDCITIKNSFDSFEGSSLSTREPSLRRQGECLENVEGQLCSHCKEGYFYLDAENPQGCLQCYCSGVTRRCSSSSLIRQPLHFNLSAIYPPQEHKFELTNRFRTHYYSDRIQVNIYHNELYFHSLFWLHQVHQTDSGEPKRETLYWSLPPQFLGNRLSSYGGQIRYKQRYTAHSGDGQFISDVDVFMIGNGVMLQYINSEPFDENEERLFIIPIKAEEGRWQKIDHQTQSSGIATRTDFLRALSNLEMIAVRSTLHTQMKESILKDVSLDEAVSNGLGNDIALSVEQCFCPAGYTGLSCESCTNGYIRQDDPIANVHRCVPCPCNYHSEECDAITKKCLNCKDHTKGDQCQLCSDGWHGDATRGTTHDCIPCDSAISNQPRECGPHLNNSAHSISKTIRVFIEGSPTRTVPAGVTVSLKCSGVSRVSKLAFNLDWIKLEGQLPDDASEASGVLTLPNIQAEDSGTYICTGSDLESVAQAQVTILVQASLQASAPKVRIEPRHQEVYLGEPVTFKCIADGYPQPKLHWYKGQNQILNPAASFTSGTGVFYIGAVEISDEGEYYCQATNSAGSDSVRTVLFVRPSEYHTLEYVHVDGVRPTARISPSNSHTAIRGESSVRFECNVTGVPVPSVRWTFIGGGPDGRLPSNSREIGGVLILSNVELANGGTYTCIASNLHGTAETQVRLNVVLSQSSPPTVNVEPIRQTIVQGQTGELRCVTTGVPKPTISWQKVEDQLDHARHKMIDDKLIIERMEVNDRGLYVCRAVNSQGISQGSAVVEIELREIPSIEIHRESRIHVPRGESAYFQCRVIGGIPTPTIEWRRSDGSPFTSNVEIVEGLLRFKEVTPSDQGKYICLAENLAGRVMAEAVLRLKGAPRLSILQSTPYRVRPGEHVRLECRLSSLEPSNQQSLLNWHKLNQSQSQVLNSVILQDRAILEFRSIKPSEGGIYVCTAESARETKAEDRIQVIVEEPSGALVPDVYIEEKVVTVAIGSRAELRCLCTGCSGRGSQHIVLKWVRGSDNAKSLPDNTKSLPDNSRDDGNGSLIIDQVKPEDSGTYHCLGYMDSTGGQSSPRLLFNDKAHLSVVAPPKIQVYPVRQTLRPGETLYLDCVAFDSSHSVTVVWSRIGAKLPAGASTELAGARLVIQGVQETDAGKFLCCASNFAGKTWGVAEVIVDQASEPIDTATEEMAILGSNLELKCPSKLDNDAAEDLTIWWKVDGSDSLPVNSQLINNELRIQNVQMDNAGRYICTSSLSGAVIDQNSVILKVKGSSRRNCKANHFRCLSGLQCVPLSVRCNQVFDCVDQSDETDCNAIPTLDISLTSNQESVFLNDNLTLNCVVQGDPMAEITWLSPNHLEPWPDNVQIAGNTLNVSRVRPENGGVYRCTVRTYAGVYNADYVLVIQSTATTPTPEIEIVESHVVPFASPISLPCKPEGLTPIRYSWKKSSSVSFDGSVSFEDSLSEDAEIGANGTLFISKSRPSDAGTYTCTAFGLHSFAEVSTIVVVEGIVPRFLQKPVSYMSLPRMPNAKMAFNLSLSVKPETLTGLLLYNEQFANHTGDFISLGLNNGYVEFRFELGAGVVMIHSEKPITAGGWHFIEISRDKHVGKLKVDSQMVVSKSASSKFIGLDLLEPLYIGGMPHLESLPASRSGFSSGFVGCISLFKMGSKHYELIKDSTEKHQIGRCETCQSSPCQNSGTCRESSKSMRGYECVCPVRFSGAHCQLSGGTCYASACHQGVCYERKAKKTFSCLCPFGKGGSRCERNISISEPSFSGGAYLAYRPPLHSLERLHLKLRIKPRFKSLHGVHLLLYSGQHLNGSGDFIALLLVNRTVQFRFDTGSGPVVIQSTQELEDEEWIDIEVDRHRREANLTVGQFESVFGRAPGRTHGLSLLTPLYLGGFNRTKMSIPIAPPPDAFEGCLGQLQINHKPVNLLRFHVESVNVENCDSPLSCKRMPCFNGGSCTEGTEGDEYGYSCQCEPNYFGQHCEKTKGPCDQANPCFNKGECQNQGGDFVCHCPIGFRGRTCAEQVEMLDPTAAQMNGHSFLSFDNSHLTQSNQSLIMFRLKTTQSNGLLFFYGQASDVGGSGKDFMAVSLNSSKLEMTFELGSGHGRVFTDVSVANDRVHHVTIQLTGRQGSIQVDDQRWVGESPGSLSVLNAEGDIYIGGVPDFASMTENRYTSGYSGCIWDITIGPSDVLDLKESPKRSRNIAPCEDEADEGSASLSIDSLNVLV